MQQETFENQMERFYQLWYDIRQQYSSWAKEQGTTYNVITTIRTVLEEQGHCTQKLICDRQRLPKQTVNTILKDFEDKGFVTFTESTEDKRNKLITLTESGLTYAKETSAALYQKDFEVANKMGFERMESLIENLSLYAQLYCEEEENREEIKK